MDIVEAFSGGDLEMRIYPEMPSVSPVYPVTNHLPWYTKIWRFLTVPTFWDMTDDYIYILGDGTALLLPYQFRFDGASTPRAVWPMINPTGCLFVPAGFHDFWYRFGCLLLVKNISEIMEKRENPLFGFDGAKGLAEVEKYGETLGRGGADKMFQRIGNEITDLRLVNWVAYTTLKHAGWAAWNNCRKKEDQYRNQIEFWLKGYRHTGSPQSGDGTVDYQAWAAV